MFIEYILVREWSKHNDLLNLIIPMVWERLGKNTKQGRRNINAPVLIEANLSPRDIVFKTANESKVIFLATGSTPLKHKHLMKLCQDVEDIGRELHNYLPDLYGLGLKTMLDKITDEELEIFDGVLKTDGNPREAQQYLNYDRVHYTLDNAIDTYNFERPLLFQSPTIDRTALTFFNIRTVCILRILYYIRGGGSEKVNLIISS